MILVKARQLPKVLEDWRVPPPLYEVQNKFRTLNQYIAVPSFRMVEGMFSSVLSQSGRTGVNDFANIRETIGPRNIAA